MRTLIVELVQGPVAWLQGSPAVSVALQARLGILGVIFGAATAGLQFLFIANR